MSITEENIDTRYLANTVLKSIEILNLISARPMSASEICLALEQNKSTVHRLLYTLEYAGFIERNNDQHNYRLGIKLVQMCSLRINDIELLTEAKPYLNSLVQDILQTVHLAVLKDNMAMFVDKIDVMNTIRMYSAIGRSIPLHCSAVGKALLLDKSDDEVLSILEKAGMERFTADTITSPTVLLEQLHQAKQNGFTVDNFEHEAHVCCIAAPVYDYRRKIIASISTAASKNAKFDRQHLIQSMKETAARISASLGYVSN